jgi:hypothetical protein
VKNSVKKQHYRVIDVVIRHKQLSHGSEKRAEMAEAIAEPSVLLYSIIEA